MIHPSPACGRGVRGEGLRSILRTRTKQLRSGQTDAEQSLWYHLRAHRFLGLKFKRQKPVGSYIVDFICIEKRLVIEIDGSQHQTNEAYDAVRDLWFSAQGFTVLRFWNNEVLDNMEAVLEKIRLAVERPHLPSPPTPLPLAGEGS